MRELVLTESTLAFAGLGAVPMNWMTVLPAYGCIAQGSCPSLVASNLTRRGTVGPFLSKTIHLVAFLERKNARVDTVCFWLWSSIVSQRSTALLKERWSHCKVPTPLFREFPKLFVFFFQITPFHILLLIPVKVRTVSLIKNRGKKRGIMFRYV